MRRVVFERQRRGDAHPAEGQSLLAREERDRVGRAVTQRMCGAVQQARFEQCRHVGGGDRPVGDAAVGGVDLDQRFEPEEAPRAVAHQVDRQSAARALDGECGGDLVGADGAGGRIAGDEDAHRGRHRG